MLRRHGTASKPEADHLKAWGSWRNRRGCRDVHARYQQKGCLWASSGDGSTLRRKSELDRAIRRLVCSQSRSRPWLQKGWPLRLKNPKHSLAGRKLVEGAACSGRAYLKSILEGVLKVFSSSSTKLRWSEAPDSFSVWISRSICSRSANIPWLTMHQDLLECVIANDLGGNHKRGDDEAAPGGTASSNKPSLRSLQ